MPEEQKAAPPLWSDLIATYADIGKARPWFAEGAIEGTPIIMLSGPEKTHKSWTGKQLAAATVLGGSWLERFPIHRPGSVVYLDGEYGAHEFARRLARLARGMGAEPHDVMHKVRHLYIANDSPRTNIRRNSRGADHAVANSRALATKDDPISAPHPTGSTFTRGFGVGSLRRRRSIVPSSSTGPSIGSFGIEHARRAFREGPRARVPVTSGTKQFRNGAPSIRRSEHCS